MRSCVNDGRKIVPDQTASDIGGDAPCGSYDAVQTRKITDIPEDLRFRVLRLLQENPRLSHREIARALGVSAGGVNYCVNALIEKGMVKVRNFRASDNKLRYAYVLTPQGIAEKAALTGRFLQRKMSEYEALKAEIESVMRETGQGEIDLPLPDPLKDPT